MLTKNFNLMILGIGIMLLSFAGPVQASSEYGSMSKFINSDAQVQLQPGWVSSCSSDFVIENMGDGKAEVRIILGAEEFTQDSIKEWGKRGYNLRSSLSFAKQLGKSVNIDDVALIENVSKDNAVRVHC